MLASVHRGRWRHYWRLLGPGLFVRRFGDFSRGAWPCGLGPGVGPWPWRVGLGARRKRPGPQPRGLMLIDVHGNYNPHFLQTHFIG